MYMYMEHEWSGRVELNIIVGSHEDASTWISDVITCEHDSRNRAVTSLTRVMYIVHSVLFTAGT